MNSHIILSVRHSLVAIIVDQFIENCKFVKEDMLRNVLPDDIIFQTRHIFRSFLKKLVKMLV